MEDLMRWIVLAGAFLTACATPSGMAADTRTYDFGSYSVSTERSGCNIASAQVFNRGQPMGWTYHTLTIGAGGTTSAIFAVNCEPVLAGGKAMCVINAQNQSLPSATAGLGCPRWDQFNMSRM
jgi:hypothetical protein